jgi:hypothetical protein
MALNNTRRQLTTKGTKNTKEDTKKKAIGNGRTESARRSCPRNYQRHDYQKLRARAMMAHQGDKETRRTILHSDFELRNYQRHDYQKSSGAWRARRQGASRLLA